MVLDFKNLFFLSRVGVLVGRGEIGYYLYFFWCVF